MSIITSVGQQPVHFLAQRVRWPPAKALKELRLIEPDVDGIQE